MTLMKSSEFDLYRDDYEDMTSDKAYDWHSRLWRSSPSQDHVSLSKLDEFFREVDATHVMEIGGWRGEAAEHVLGWNDGISSWRNYEVCREAANSPVFEDERYHSIHHWVNPGSPFVMDGDTLVCSHVLEHMNEGQVEFVMRSTKARYLYVDVPLDRDEWSGTTCFHVFRGGWPRMSTLIESVGFKKFMGGGMIAGYRR